MHRERRKGVTRRVFKGNQKLCARMQRRGGLLTSISGGSFETSMFHSISSLSGLRMCSETMMGVVSIKVGGSGDLAKVWRRGCEKQKLLLSYVIDLLFCFIPC